MSPLDLVVVQPPFPVPEGATATLLYGADVIESLATLPEGSVHMVATSPPFWGLRDYGTGEWEGGNDPECEHKVRLDPKTESSTLNGGTKSTGHQQEGFRAVCPRCGARRVDEQIGLESTPDEYVARIVQVFDAVKRVLRTDGTVWLNLGDTYAGWVGPARTGSNFGGETHQQCVGRRGSLKDQGLKEKDLVGIPWRVALALQADGWYLRNDIVWSKGNVMPEAEKDRCTRSHEYVFLLAHPESRGRYYFDADAIRESHRSSGTVTPWQDKEYDQTMLPESHHQEPGEHGMVKGRPKGIAGFGVGGRNKRTVWKVNPKPYRGAHFAVWPEKLVEPMVLAGTSEHGVCGSCGTPWRRVVEREGSTWSERKADGYPLEIKGNTDALAAQSKVHVGGSVSRTVGWEPGCKCEEAGEPPQARAVVMDIFSGSATTGLVATRHGRKYIGLDLNAEYLDLAVARVEGREAPDSDGEVTIEGGSLDLFG